MEGKGRLEVKSYPVPGGDRVCVEISDTGPGIPEEILPHIFDPFYTTKQDGKGTGLGLSLAYGIVEEHGGTLKAENRRDQGATFLIELPLKQNGKSEEKDEQEQS
jgi:signal transduction histidine kinase